MQITLPFVPRGYQKPFFRAFRGGAKRLSLEWHRKAGKELSCLQALTIAALERPGPYFYFLPTYGQAKRVVWEGVDRDSNKFIGHYIPKSIIKRRNETELFLQLPNDSTIRLIGLDKDTVDTVIGTNPYGVVFSEYAVSDPIGWRLMLPVLRQNNGWAIFNFTPRGSNHATEQHDTWLELMKNDPTYFAQTLTVAETGCVSEAEIDEERRSGTPEEMIQQEFYCSRTAMNRGSYFGPYLEQARKDGRLTSVPYDNRLPVHTAWDLGVNDPTAIWFFQLDPGGYVRLFRYYERSKADGARGFPDHLAALREFQREYGYVYGVHLAPHDMGVTEWGTSTARAETASKMGLDFTIVANGKRIDKNEQIEACRSLFSRFVFDAAGCERGLKAVGAYEAEYDELHGVYKPKPLHNWASHGADALQTLACGIESVTNDVFDSYGGQAPQRFAIMEFDVIGYDYERTHSSSVGRTYVGRDW